MKDQLFNLLQSDYSSYVGVFKVKTVPKKGFLKEIETTRGQKAVGNTFRLTYMSFSRSLKLPYIGSAHVSCCLV